ncbi:armadillo-type protein [Flagelloscypha sp. PMI_526]|nr:armadillo-type protein [Flagelloscypha sp. PMI_526]
MDGAKEKKEDRRVVNAALMAVGNLVNDFSPIRKPYVDQGLVEILCVFLRDDLPDLEPNFRLNALWACKNLLVRAPPSLVSRVMKGVGWGRLQGFLSEETPSNIREQAFSLLRNIAYDDDGIHSVYSEFGIDFVLKALCSALEGTSEDVAVEAANLLGNLSNSTQEYANTVLLNPSSSEHTSHSYAAEMETSTPPILNAIKTALTEHTNPDLRRPLLFCLRRLSDSPKARRQLLEAGINGTLKRICQWGGKVPGVPGSRGGLSDDREVVDLAKAALSYLEHGGLEY